jgi:hypothetical protein
MSSAGGKPGAVVCGEFVSDIQEFLAGMQGMQGYGFYSNDERR